MKADQGRPARAGVGVVVGELVRARCLLPLPPPPVHAHYVLCTSQGGTSPLRCWTCTLPKGPLRVRVACTAGEPHADASALLRPYLSSAAAVRRGEGMGNGVSQFNLSAPQPKGHTRMGWLHWPPIASP